MIIYILKSSVCLILLLVVYHLFLEKEKMHQFNRFYLLGSILFSFLAPAYIIHIEATIAAEPFITMIPEVDLSNTTTMIAAEEVIIQNNPVNYSTYLLSIYALFSLLFLYRFSSNLFQLLNKIRTNQKIQHKEATLVLVNQVILPYTFFNYVFINKTDYYSRHIKDEMFTHELTHVRQKHSVDILLIELLQLIFWFNPALYFLKKAMKLNHEFLADDKVIEIHNDTCKYQQLLLNIVDSNGAVFLASNINYSLTKKRLVMMTTLSSSTKMLIKKMAIIPFLIGLTILFAERIEAQEKKTEKKNTQQTKPVTQEIDSIKLYNDYYYYNIKFGFVDEKGKTTFKVYDQLTNYEKAQLIPPLPLTRQKKIPSQKQLEEWKDSKLFGLWLDRKLVDNTALNKYKHTDFAYYFISGLHKNAVHYGRYKYHLSLSTNDYFDKIQAHKIEDFKNYLKGIIKPTDTIYIFKMVKKAQIALKEDIIKAYIQKHQAYQELRNKGKHFVFKTEKEQNIMKKLHSDLGGMYFRMSRANKNLVPYPESPLPPYVTLKNKNGTIYYKKRSELTEEEKASLPAPPTPSERYNLKKE